VTKPMSPDELRDRAARLPRVSLTEFPTPLHECPRFAEGLGNGVRFFMKRDDLTGLGMGGNKLRKLEFSMAAALGRGCDVIVHGLAGQSNYCRQTVAAANRVGLPCILVLRRDQKTEDPAQGNLLLDHVFGADVRFVDPGRQGEAKTELIAELEGQGRVPYLIGHDDEVLGAVGYSLCMAEMLGQLAAMDVQADFVCVTGQSGTLGGLVLARRLLGFDGQVLGFHPAPQPDATALRTPTALFATEAAALLGLDETFTTEDIHNSADYAGPAYGTPTDACLDAISLLGRTEGLLVGPVYTAKGLAGVIDYVRTGRIPAGSTVVFVHTGGLPEVFTYNAEIMQHLGSA